VKLRREPVDTLHERAVEIKLDKSTYYLNCLLIVVARIELVGCVVTAPEIEEI